MQRKLASFTRQQLKKQKNNFTQQIKFQKSWQKNQNQAKLIFKQSA